MDKKKFVSVFGNDVFRGSFREDEVFSYRVLDLLFHPQIGEIDVRVKITDRKTSESRDAVLTFNFGVKGERETPELQRF